MNPGKRHDNSPIDQQGQQDRHPIQRNLMKMISVSRRDTIAIITLENGVTNAIHPALIQELRSALKDIKDDHSALVLTGNEKFFSIGFDLPTLLAFTRSEMFTFLLDFQTMLFTLSTLPIPVVCAVKGHAPGGGTTIIVSCDGCVAADSNIKVGLNESRLGLVVPFWPDLMCRYLVGEKTARQLIIEGTLMNATQACHIGLIDETCEKKKVMPRAIEKATSLAAIPSKAFHAIKIGQIEKQIQAYHAGVEQKTNIFLDLWFDKEAQEKLHLALKKF